MSRRPLAALAALLAACALRPLAKPPGDPEAGVWIRWWGHSCFTLRDSVGRVLLIDPFDDTVGYAPPPVKADIRLVTHAHFDHDRPLPADLPALRSTGTHTLAGVEVTGLWADHDDQGGRRHGRTRMYVWEMGGLRFAHLGDIGQAGLRPEQAEALGGVDVLFVPVGGKTTVDGPRAAAIVKGLAPRVAVPMHFGTPRVRFFDFDGPEAFAALFNDVRRAPPGEFRLRRAELPAQTAVWVPAVPPPLEGGAP